ncbi:MAG: hypothetical protein RBS25_02895 [Bacilli bacterium]|jgi:hypothetical protein|nr:hypothetical protein [Bacilli bacterium]
MKYCPVCGQHLDKKGFCVNCNKKRKAEDHKNNGFFQTLWNGIVGLFKLLTLIFDATKFIFRIPLTTLASSIFTAVIVILIKPLINFLPDDWNIGLVEILIAFVIFIVINRAFFMDHLYHNLLFDSKKYLYQFVGAAIIWSIPLLLFQFDAKNVLDFFQYGDIPSIITTVFIAFYGPHMWLAVLTKEFLFSIIGALLINTLIFIGISSLTFTKITKD